jgi:hypothetical protein
MALTYAQITAIATNLIDNKFTDNVYGSNPVIKRFADKSKKVDGGVKIQVPVIASTASAGGAYTDLGTLTITRDDQLTAAEYNWRQYYQAIRISQLDMMKAGGDAAKLDLVKAKLQIGEISMADNLGTGLFSNGGSDAIDGFQAMIDDDTYGGIAVADMATWVSYLLANSGTDRPLTLGLLQQLIGGCTYGKDVPTLLVAKQNVYDECYNLFQPHQRIESDEVGKLGFKSLMVNGVPLVVDSHMKAKTIFAINENYAQLVIHKNNNMRKEHHASLETTDSSLHKIFWAGNLTCSSRRTHGELADIKVAA